MAPKRNKSRITNENNGEKYKNIVISDVLCPICRSILIEPVTLPCNHGFCLTCFNGTMENTTLTCPLCRTRIGSWLRSARKEKRVINDVLWQIIQRKFSKEIGKKLAGDDITLEETINVKLANPGEIRREYEIQLEREKSEIQKRHESESKASESIIKKILEEEQNAAKIEEEKLRMDEEVAKRLAAEDIKAGSSSAQSHTSSKAAKKSSIDRYLIALSKKKQEPNDKKSKIEPVASSSKNVTKNHFHEVAPVAKSTEKQELSNVKMLYQKVAVKKQCSKAYQHLLLTKTLSCRAESNGSDSGDSIKQEMLYFKPIRVAPTADTRRDANVSLSVLKVTPVVAQNVSSTVIRSPRRNLLVRIGSHAGSAFVSCSPEIKEPPPKLKQPSIVDESGKLIKQYYNRKQNTLRATREPYTLSPPLSPCLGFKIQNEQKHATIMRDLVSTMSEHVNRNLARNSDKNILKEIPKQNLSIPQTRASKRNSNSKKDLELSPKKLNGCDVKTGGVSSSDLQEKLDLEFAKRLHEELNNLRSRPTRPVRASIQTKRNSARSTRSSPRKRQTTLDELMSPKKFKI